MFMVGGVSLINFSGKRQYVWQYATNLAKAGSIIPQKLMKMCGKLSQD